MSVRIAKVKSFVQLGMLERVSIVISIFRIDASEGFSWYLL